MSDSIPKKSDISRHYGHRAVVDGVVLTRPRLARSSKERTRSPHERYPELKAKFFAVEGSQEFLDTLVIMLADQDLETARSLMNDFYAKLHPPAIELTAPLVSLGLPIRTINILESAGYMNVNALLMAKEDSLTTLPNMGPETMSGIRAALDMVRRRLRRSEAPSVDSAVLSEISRIKDDDDLDCDL